MKPRLTIKYNPEPMLTFLEERDGADWFLLDNDIRYELFRDVVLWCVITVPTGFITDLSSIPRILWPWEAPTELGTAAPVLHDWLYGCCGAAGASCIPRYTFLRSQVDEMFLVIASTSRIPTWRARAAYGGVRLFGGFPWRRHAEEIATGKVGA